MTKEEMKARRAAKLNEFHAKLKPWQPQQVIGMCLLIFSSVFPAIRFAGFGRGLFDPLLWLSLDSWMAISAIIGAITGAVFYPDFRFFYVGLLPGMCIGPTVLLLCHKYAQWREGPLFALELTYVFFLGTVPWFILYYLLLRWRVLRGMENEEARNRASLS
jgi:hypothetical protein